MASGATYNVTRFTRQVLKRYRRSPPSVVVHLYPNHFRFEHQHGNFSYDSPMKCFLESIREQKLPSDLLDVLDQQSVPYYDGCLIVEVHDHRQYSSSTQQSTQQQPTQQQPINPLSFQSLPSSKLFTFSINPSNRKDSLYHQKGEVYRIVLAPNPQTLWTELGIYSNNLKEQEDGGLSQEEAIKMESIILNRTVPALCLDPSIQTSRIANSMLRATTLRPPKRKRFCNSGECDDDDGNQGTVSDDDDDDDSNVDEDEGRGGGRTKKERDNYERLMKVGDEGIAKLKGPAFSRLAFIQSYREKQSNPHSTQSQSQSQSQQQPMKAQPGSAVTSIRLGGSSSTTSSNQNPQQRAASPAVSTISQTNRHQKKQRNNNQGGGDMSDGATSTTSTTIGNNNNNIKKPKNKIVDPEKKQQKLNAKKKEKERKKLQLELQQEQQQQQQQQQQQASSGLGQSGGQAKFTWSGSPQ